MSLLDELNAKFHDAIGLHGIAEDIRDNRSEKEKDQNLKENVQKLVIREIEKQIKEGE